MATKSNRASERTDPSDDRDAQLQLQVLAKRRLCIHRHHAQAGEHVVAREGCRPGLVERGEITLGVHLAGERPLAVLGRQQRKGGSDRGLSDPALAGHEDQAPFEQSRRPRGRHFRRIGPLRR